MFKMFFSKGKLFPVSWYILSSCVLILYAKTLSVEELKETCGFKMSTGINSTRNLSMSRLTGTRFMACESVSCLPPSFTWLDHKDRCPSLGQVTWQLKCGSCWAIAAAAVISDRHCLQTHEQRTFSAKHIAGCAMSDGGCYGGDPKDAMEYYVKHGVVTGEDPTVNEQPTGCVPYFIEKNHRFSCETTCESEYSVSFESDKRRGTSSYTIDSRNVTEIKLDLMKFGPLVATMEVFDDFRSYKKGIYKHSPNSKSTGGHAVRLIGWGKEDGIPYWICANSFGERWGDMGGFFRILLGQNECNIESYLIGVQTSDKAEVTDGQFNVKGLSTTLDPVTISPPESCPSSMTYDLNYPNICYQIKERSYPSWNLALNNATDFCHQIDSRATLPIFHDLSEYISYSKWAYKHMNLSDCHSSWLGISYNTTSKNYSWIDGFNVPFNFYDHDVVFKENYSFTHDFCGSNIWTQIETNKIFPWTVCQLRINKNSHLKTATNVLLDYPKSKKCPQKENWFYDSYYDICYYYDKHDSRNWTSSFAHCKSEVGGSLPYFMTENEFDSFVNLTRTLHVPCGKDIWLGYYGQNYSFVNINGSANSFFRWTDNFPIIYSDISYVFFTWFGYSNFDHIALQNQVMDERYIEGNRKIVFCQCRSGNCKTEKVGNDQFDLKVLSTTYGSVTISPPESCPSSAAYDANYPNVCYLYISAPRPGCVPLFSGSWDDALNYCHQIDPRATLPIFHDLSEYISYSKLAYKHMELPYCHQSWLGISYNTTSNNYSWIDGSDVSFDFYDHDVVFKENYSFTHDFYGSNNWTQEESTKKSWIVCQLQINKNSLLKTATNVLLDYPKSKKCPQKENWFYDNYSDICYYYDRHDRRNWTSAFAHCKNEVGGSLPYFITESEFDSFAHLTRTLHVACWEDVWLGYYTPSYSFVDVNGSTNSFLRWSPGFPVVYSNISYVYFTRLGDCFVSYNTMRNQMDERYIEWNRKIVFCQCRSGNCKTEKIGNQHFSSLV